MWYSIGNVVRHFLIIKDNALLLHKDKTTDIKRGFECQRAFFKTTTFFAISISTKH